jgi:hypothetical protein
MKPNSEGTTIVLITSDPQKYVERLHQQHAARTKKS